MWKDIGGYEGYYEVNEHGSIRSVERIVDSANGVRRLCKARYMKQHMNKDGYMTVKLSRGGKSKRFFVHRIVANAFVSGYKSGMEVNHKDFNRANNESSNLEWIYHADNVKYTKLAGRHSSDRNLLGINNPNYHNHTLHKRFESEPELRMVQSRPGARNGRARAVRAYLVDGEQIVFDYLGQCAKYLINNGYTRCSDASSVSTYIRKAAERGRAYFGVRFELL